jgi:hypothetical protein
MGTTDDEKCNLKLIEFDIGRMSMLIVFQGRNLGI